MFVRLIYKLVVAVSLLLGIAMLILSSRTRHSDLLISGASGGTYRELRLGNSQLALMFVTTWPGDQHPRVGRPVVAKPLMTPPVVSGSSAIVSTPGARLSISGGTLTLTNTPASASQILALFDGADITLQPNAKGWWPPTKSTGSAMVGDTPRMNLTGTTGMVAITGINTNAVTASSATSGTVTTAPAASMTIVAAGTTATTSTVTGTSGGTLTFSLSPAKGSGQLKFSGGTNGVTLNPGKPTTAQVTSGSTTVNWTTLYIFTAHAYERYALPLWAVALIVMMPAWWALLVTALRMRRRRSRRRRGLCERCGYDLRGNPSGSTCPECGTATTGIPAPPTGDQLLARLR